MPRTRRIANEERLSAIRDSLQALAALSFIAMRGLEFSRVTLTKFVPDVIRVWPLAAAAAHRNALALGAAIALGFNALQVFWLVQVLTTMVDKIFFGGDGSNAHDERD